MLDIQIYECLGGTMQIRRRNKRIEFLRSKYVKEDKRNRQVFLGSAANHLEELPADLREKMTDDEIVQAEAYYAALKQKELDWTLSSSKMMVPYYLKALAEYLDNNDVNQDKAKEIYLAMSAVEKKLKKQGYKKTDLLKTKAPIKIDERQKAMFDKTEEGGQS